MGIMGIKKSYFIRIIRSRFWKMAKSGFKSSVAMIALIDIVTFNINGGIIHLTLSIPIMNDKKLELKSICLKQFYCKKGYKTFSTS